MVTRVTMFLNINKIENQNKREIKKSKFFYIKNDLKNTKID